jgi:serine/threonine protein kinase
MHLLNRATGGELFDRICERGKFTEKDAVSTMKAVLKGVEYLHAHHVVHRGSYQYPIPVPGSCILMVIHRI